MELIAIGIIAALTFGVCFLVDKGASRLFHKEHREGSQVRLSKKYGSVGTIVGVLGIACVLTGLSDGAVLIVSGSVLVLLGVGLVVYYMTSGIFYREDTFTSTAFGRKATTYRYEEIEGQLLYVSYRNTIIELHLKNGRSVQVLSGMNGAYDFLDHAFAAWLRQTGKAKEDCKFHDPDNSCWFPSMNGGEEET